MAKGPNLGSNEGLPRNKIAVPANKSRCDTDFAIRSCSCNSVPGLLLYFFPALGGMLKKRRWLE
jgi:hypothetical protein